MAAGGVETVQSEEFVLEFGKVATKTTAASGHIVRTLVYGAIAIATRGAFDEAIKGGHLSPRSSQDKKGYISWRLDDGRSVRVQRPVLVRDVEESWREQNGAIGRWISRVRADGSPTSAPEFWPLDRGGCDASLWERVVEAGRKLAADIGPHGS